MWDVTDRFLSAIRNPHKTHTVVSVTTPNGEPTVVKLKAGGITVQSASNIRRRGTLTLEGNSSTFELLATAGAVVEVTHGLVYGNSSELIPVFTGEVIDPRQVFGDGTIRVTVADLAQRVSRNRFAAAYQPAAGTTRVAAISAVASGAFNSLDVEITAADAGTVGAGRLWAENRWDAIRDLGVDAGAESFFRPDGSFLIRDQPTIADNPVWTVNAGDGGVLKSGARTRPTSDFYNTVVVRPTATDGSQTWTEQTVTVPDGDPRHPDLVGTSPFYLTSPTITSAEGAISAGLRKLSRLSGLVESLQLDAVANPALEAGDVVRVITPNLNLEAGRTFQHFIDALSLDLATGGMSLSTRSQVVVDD